MNHQPIFSKLACGGCGQYFVGKFNNGICYRCGKENVVPKDPEKITGVHKIKVEEILYDGNNQRVVFCVCGKRLKEVYREPEYKHE